MAPKVTRVAVLWNPTNPGNTHQLRGAERAAAALGLRLQPVEARSPGEIDRAFAAMTRERAEALLVLLDATFYDQRARIVDLAAKSRLPAVYGYSVFAETGVSCPMPRTVLTGSDSWPSTWTRSSRGRSLPTSRWSSPGSSSWSSISRPPRRSGSRSHHRCC